VLKNDRQAFLEHIGVGYPPEWPSQDRHVLERRRDQISEGADYRWLLRAAVTRSHPSMIGRIGFHGPPDADGVVEIGYAIDAAFRLLCLLIRQTTDGRRIGVAVSSRGGTVFGTG
jgi:RimJ/RimL family protein N-acetyltransferase